MIVAAPGGVGVLLERGESMSVLDGLLASVRSGSEGRLILVGGKAGVGKTALLRRFCETQDTAVRILWGACEPLLAPRPLGPLLDVAEATGGELQQLIAGAGRPHEVAAELLRELRGRGPTVLVLEDVHWADEATLDVLTLLAARIGSAPALVLASYRDDELDRAEQLRVVLGELARRPERLKVELLSRAGVGELAEPHGVDGKELYRRTGGNPFFVIEALAAGGEQIPETVRDAVLARAAHLSEPARRLLEAVAVVPGQVDLWLLELLAGELVERLEECLASGMLSAGRASNILKQSANARGGPDADKLIALMKYHEAALRDLDKANGGFAINFNGDELRFKQIIELLVNAEIMHNDVDKAAAFTALEGFVWFQFIGALVAFRDRYWLMRNCVTAALEQLA